MLGIFIEGIRSGNTYIKETCRISLQTILTCPTSKIFAQHVDKCQYLLELSLDSMFMETGEKFHLPCEMVIRFLKIYTNDIASIIDTYTSKNPGMALMINEVI